MFRKVQRTSGLICACALGVANWAGAAVVTTASGTNGADAYVRQGTATTNFGGDPALTAKDTGDDAAGTNRKFYLRFDLSSINNPVTSARLSLSVFENDGGGTPLINVPQDFEFHVYGLNDGSTAGSGILGEDWAENAINWNNAPANVTSGSGARNSAIIGAGTANGGQAVLLGSFSLTSGAGTQVLALGGSVNSKLVQFLNADSNHAATLIVTRSGYRSAGGATQTNSNSVFNSKESLAGPAPTLLINQGLTGSHAASAISDTSWRVTSTDPTGTPWNSDVAYNDSDAAGWQDAVSNGGSNIWLGSLKSASAPNKVWIRHVFTLDGPVSSAGGTFSFDDNGQLYINGHLIIDDSGGGASTFNLASIDPTFFNVGDNVIAVHGIDTIAPDCSVSDELNLVIAPEPAGLGLLALGSLGLLARRRRTARTAAPALESLRRGTTHHGRRDAARSRTERTTTARRPTDSQPALAAEGGAAGKHCPLPRAARLYPIPSSRSGANSRSQ